jgi:hypothetical protein
VRFGRGGDAFTERVESDGDALAVDGFGDAKGVVEHHAGDESPVEAGSESGVLEEAA